jgi:hypothetical protein
MRANNELAPEPKVSVRLNNHPVYAHKVGSTWQHQCAECNQWHMKSKFSAAQLKKKKMKKCKDCVELSRPDVVAMYSSVTQQPSSSRLGLGPDVVAQYRNTQVCLESMDSEELQVYMAGRPEFLRGYALFLDAYGRDYSYDSSAAAAQLVDKYGCLVTSSSTALRVLNDGAGWRAADLSRALPQHILTHIDVVIYGSAANLPSTSTTPETTSRVQIISGTNTSSLGVGVFDVRLIVNSIYHWKTLKERVEDVVLSLRIGGIVMMASVEGSNSAIGIKFANLLRAGGMRIVAFSENMLLSVAVKTADRTHLHVLPTLPPQYAPLTVDAEVGITYTLGQHYHGSSTRAAANQLKKTRFNEHLLELKSKRHENPRLQSWYDEKYAEDNDFDFSTEFINKLRDTFERKMMQSPSSFVMAVLDAEQALIDGDDQRFNVRMVAGTRSRDASSAIEF